MFFLQKSCFYFNIPITMKRSGGMRCSVNSCSSSSLNHNRDANHRPIRFFRFPNPIYEKQINSWKLACSDDSIMSSDPSKLHHSNRICSLHFEEHLLKEHRLKEDAIPTLNLEVTFPNSVFDEHSYFTNENIEVAHYIEIDDEIEINSGSRSIGTQTECVMVNKESQTSPTEKFDCQLQTDMRLSAKTPRKHKIIEKMKDQNAYTKRVVKEKAELQLLYDQQMSQEKNISKELFKNACDEHLPDFFGNMAKHVSDLKDKKLKGRRYTARFKRHALSIYYQSPRMYKRLVQKYHFPSISTLRKMTGNVHQPPGLSNIMFEHLERKMNGKSKLEKMCVLTMDEVSLKANFYYNIKKDEIIGFEDLGFGKTFKPAKNALVLMARGINEKWKQPLAYFFLNSTCSVEYLQIITTDCIRRMNNAGIDVWALISDMGSNFIKLSRKLGINNENPVFQVDGKKLYYIFDTPHLIKAVRNMLMKYTVEFDGQEASWKDIEKIYNLEKERDLRMIPKLTEAHVNPTNFQKMRVKYATQVFSSTVVSAISTYVANGEMSTAAIGTANMLEKFDHTFDILNSSTRRTKNQYKKPYRGTDSQEIFLLDMLNSLKKMKVYIKQKKSGKTEITGTFKAINCFQVTIRGIMGLWNDLKKEGVTELRTRRLNQDCLENFFGKVRQQQGNSVNPTPIQFMNAFKKLTCLDILDCSETFNCEADNDVLLLDNSEDIPVATDSRFTQRKCPFKITNADFRRDDLPGKNMEHYISGYLMRKCLNKHRCINCEEYSKARNEVDATNLFCHFKGDTEKYGKRTGVFGKLLMPEETFVNYISSLESILIENMQSIALGKVGEDLYNMMKIVPFTHPCPEFPYEYMLRLFIRLRTYYVVKYANRKFQTDEMYKRRDKRNRKLDNLKHN